MKHELKWDTNAWEDYIYWIENNKNMVKKIYELIKAIDRDPFKGIGKPEPLLHSLSGFWSRRLDREHRLVYKVEKKIINLVSCRHHYVP